MIAGMYLGEILRLSMIHLINQKAIFGGVLPEALEKEWSLDTKNLTYIEK